MRGHVVCVAILAACGGVEPEPMPPPADPRCAALAAELDALRVTREVPGALLGFTSPDGACLVAAGTADLASARPMTPESLFRIGSATKTFTAAALLLLSQEKRLNLGDSLAKWLPGYFPDDADIKLLHLATHTSGLYDFTRSQWFADRMSQPIDPLEIVAYVASQPRAFPINSSIDYCNTGYVILRIVIERASGMSWADFVRTRLLVPNALDETYIDWSTLPEPESRSYQRDGTRWVDTSNASDPSWGIGSGAMVASLRDLLAWERALYGGALLDANHQEALLYPIARYSPADAYSIGTFRHETPAGVLYGHTGTLFGSTTYMFTLPSADVQVVAFMNREVDRYEFANLAWNAAIGVKPH